jgi:FtsP/CotA-like multicopper oxidase with cupredoxin domain
MISRRTMFSRTALLGLGAALFGRGRGAALAAQEPMAPMPNMPGMPGMQEMPGRTHAHPKPGRRSGGYTPVTTPNGATLPYTMKDGVKELHLIAEPVRREFAPGMEVECWGYNGATPGPTIEAVEGERVRILVSNRLPEPTTVHWHGILLPSGMDGVGGLNQPHIQPGETYAYEFTLRQHGTHMYHPHADEMVQMAMGMQGFFIIHPKAPEGPRIDRDFCIFPHMWAIRPGSARTDTAVMLDFNIFTFNGRVYPGTAPLVVRLGDRVRLRFASVNMTDHPLHLHGHRFWVVETDGGQIPRSAWWPETTLNVSPGTTRAVEFIADNPGDWALHCHKNHHTMNAMGHDVPNLLGVDQSGVEDEIRKLVGGYMAMGETGMSEHAAHAAHMPGLPNTLPMMTGTGPFGPIEMGGMFTVFKVREHLASYDQDPGWYENPPGTVARKVAGPDEPMKEHEHHHPGGARRR